MSPSGSSGVGGVIVMWMKPFPCSGLVAGKSNSHDPSSGSGESGSSVKCESLGSLSVPSGIWSCAVAVDALDEMCTLIENGWSQWTTGTPPGAVPREPAPVTVTDEGGGCGIW